MIVNIKKLGVDMEIKNRGLEIEVRDTTDNFLGDLVITKSGVTWCKGKTSVANGVKKSWEELIKAFEE